MEKTRRYILYCVFYIICAGFGFSQSAGAEKLFIPMDPVMAMNPKTLGQGFAYTANAFGYNSFFYNPAGYAVKRKNGTGKTQNGDITLLSVNAWMFGDGRFYSALFNPGKFVNDLQAEFSRLTAAVSSITASGAFDNPEVFIKELAKNPEIEVVYESLMNYLSGGDIGLNFNGKYPTLGEITADSSVLTAWLGSGPGSNAEKLESLARDTNKLLLITEKLPGIIITNLVDQAGGISAILPILPRVAEAGANVGIGVVKSGFGFGLTANVDAKFSGFNPFNIELSPTVMLNLGYAFKLFDEKLLIGFNVRPMVKVAFLQMNATQVSALLDLSKISRVLSDLQYATELLPLYSGYGVGLDFGAIFRLTPNISLSAVLKDAPTFMRMYRPKLDAFFSGSQFSLGSLFYSAVPNVFYVPPDLVLGAAWQTNGNRICNFSANVQIDNWLPMIVYAHSYGFKFDWLKMFKIGAEFELLRFLTLQAGFGNGYITGGLGLDLFFAQLNVAAAYRPPYDGTYPVYGFSAEFAVRF